MSQEASSRPIIGLSTLLGVAFIVLKLCGVIDWSWWWVLAPFWIPFAIGLLILLTIGCAGVVLAMWESRNR